MNETTSRLVSSVGDQIIELVAARQKHDQALAECEVDWDYFGQYERDLVEKAEQGLAVALDDYILDCIGRRLK